MLSLLFHIVLNLEGFEKYLRNFMFIKNLQGLLLIQQKRQDF